MLSCSLDDILDNRYTQLLGFSSLNLHNFYNVIPYSLGDIFDNRYTQLLGLLSFIVEPTRTVIVCSPTLEETHSTIDARSPIKRTANQHKMHLLAVSQFLKREWRRPLKVNLIYMV